MKALATEPLYPEQLPEETELEFAHLKLWLQQRPRPAVPPPLRELAAERAWVERACAFDWQTRIAGLEPAEQVRLTLEAARTLLCVSAQKMLRNELQSSELRLQPKDFNSLLEFFSDPKHLPRSEEQFDFSRLSPEEQTQFLALAEKAKKQ